MKTSVNQIAKSYGETKMHQHMKSYETKDPHDCVKINKPLKLSENMTFLWQGKVSSGCKMSCGIKNNDINELINMNY